MTGRYLAAAAPEMFTELLPGPFASLSTEMHRLLKRFSDQWTWLDVYAQALHI